MIVAVALLVATPLLAAQARPAPPGIRVMRFTSATSADSAALSTETDRITSAVNAALQRDSAVRWLPLPTPGQRPSSNAPRTRFIVAGTIGQQPDSTFLFKWSLTNVETTERMVVSSATVVPYAEDLVASEVRSKIDMALSRPATARPH